VPRTAANYTQSHERGTIVLPQPRFPATLLKLLTRVNVMKRSIPFALFATLGLLTVGCAHHHHHHDDDDEGVTLVRIEDLPPNVRDHFYHDHPGCDVREIHVEHEGGEVHYHFMFNDHGHAHQTEYRHEGDEIHSEYR
jgi:hypothetical protein